MSNIRISALGDSHSRCFSDTNIFTPFFLGPGSKFNLVKNSKAIKIKCKEVMDIIFDDFNYHMILFGEPSCRLQVNNDHHIHKKKFNKLNLVNKKVLNKIVKDYINIIEYLNSDKLIVCAPLSVYPPSLKCAKMFSEQIGKYCKDSKIKFIDIKKYYVKDNFIEKAYKADSIHASQKILPFIEKELMANNIDVKIQINTKSNFEEIRQAFVKDDRFGCYVKRKKI